MTSQTTANTVPQIRVVFMGTPPLAAEILEYLTSAGYHIVAAVTRPPRAQGREQESLPSAVATSAQAHALPLLMPEKLDEAFLKELAHHKPDLIIVAAYGKILPKKILDLPGFGCLNIHYSLLPKFRGASPIQNALLFGEEETGVSLMLMDEGLDTGPLIAQEKLLIAPDDTTATLTPKLNQLAQILLGRTLSPWIERSLSSVPQPETGAILCQLIERSDGAIQWSWSAQEIYNRYRAFTLWPGIYCFWKKGNAFFRVKLKEISIESDDNGPKRHLGEVSESVSGVSVQTGAGLLRLKRIQLEGKKELPIDEFIRGNPDFLGAHLS